MKKYLFFLLFSSLLGSFKASWATELVVRLMAVGEEEEAMARRPRYIRTVPLGDGYRGLGLMFEERVNGTANYAYDTTPIGGGQRYVDKERTNAYHWTASVFFGPWNTQISVGSLIPGQDPKLTIRYEDKQVNRFQKVPHIHGRPLRLDDRSNEAGFHYHAMRKCIFEWVIPNGFRGGRKGLGDLVAYINDPQRPFRQTHTKYFTEEQNCTTFSLAVLRDLGLLQNFMSQPKSSLVPRWATFGGGATALVAGTALLFTPAAPVAILAGGGAIVGGLGAWRLSKNVEKAEFAIEEMMNYFRVIANGPNMLAFTTVINGGQNVRAHGFRNHQVPNGVGLFLNKRPELLDIYRQYVNQRGIRNVQLTIQ